ncbi:hypothetical protein MNBD_NITROSPINAE02-1037 [hydrothermal vent metagenome]|uniref:Peptidase S1 domain-containing protein n=1 Tax=hydrothermal vent metagenome TaxID=652676 RepID=A0A3B1C347_9ZZZZ
MPVIMEWGYVTGAGIKTLGYPGEVRGQRNDYGQFLSTGEIIDANSPTSRQNYILAGDVNNIFVSNSHNSQGSSGGPVFFYDGAADEYYIISVISAGAEDNSYTASPRFTGDLVSLLYENYGWRPDGSGAPFSLPQKPF